MKLWTPESSFDKKKTILLREIKNKKTFGKHLVEEKKKKCPKTVILPFAVLCKKMNSYEETRNLWIFFSSSLSHNNLNKLHRFWPCHLDVKHHRRRKVSKRHIFEATENRIINRPARQRRSIVCTPGEKLFFLRHNRTCQTVFYFFSALPFRCSPLVQYNCIAKHWKQLNYALIHIVWLNGKKMKIRLNHGCVCVGSFPKKKSFTAGEGSTTQIDNDTRSTECI